MRNSTTDNSKRPEARPVLAHPDHNASLLDAEVRLLVRELTPFRVLIRQQLARRVNADIWHAGTFDAALRAGAQRGAIQLLPFGFVALPKPSPASPGNRTRSTRRRRMTRRLSSALDRVFHPTARSSAPDIEIPPISDWW